MKHLLTQLGAALIIMAFAFNLHAQISHTDCVTSVNTECYPCYYFQCTTVNDQTGVCTTSCRSVIPFCDPAAIVISTETTCQYLYPDACPDITKPYFCTLIANRFDMCKNVACGSISTGFCTASPNASITKAQRLLAVIKARRAHA